jgi:hypothetical protein
MNAVHVVGPYAPRRFAVYVVNGDTGELRIGPYWETQERTAVKLGRRLAADGRLDLVIRRPGDPYGQRTAATRSSAATGER